MALNFPISLVGKSGSGGIDQYYSTQEALGPIHRWKLNETSGITINNDILNTNSSLLPNNGSAWTGGSLGQAGAFPESYSANFNGVDGYGNLGFTKSVGNGNPTTFEFIVHSDYSGYVISESRVGSGDINKIVISVLGNSKTVRLGFLHNRVGDGYFYYINTPDALQNGFNHVVCTIGEANGFSDVKIFINGSLSVRKNDVTDIVPPVTPRLWEIGRWKNHTYSTNYASGAIDSVCVYDYVLSDGDILNNFKASSL